MKNEKGFTLVEILAVIAIMAILAVAASVGVSSTLQKQRQKLAYQAEENIAQAALTFYDSKGTRYIKPCLVNGAADEKEYTTITPENVKNINNYLREKFGGLTGENLYERIRDYATIANSDPREKYELDTYINVSNRACYKLVTVGELIEQGLITDADGMCDKSSLIVVYRKADAKNTAGIMTSVQEVGVCKSTRKTESGPVITINPFSNLALSSSKEIKVTVTTESTKLKPSFKMYYGWSHDKMIKPTSWNELNFNDNTDTKASASISINTLDGTRYLWIKGGTELDNRNNKTTEMIAGPYGFLPSVFVTYDVNTGDPSSCPAKKTVVFNKLYGKNVRDENEALCKPTKTGYDFKGWIRENILEVKDDTKVDIKIDHTLVAKWEPHVYTIALNKNNATNSPTSSIKITYDSNTLNPSTITVPIRTYKVKGFGLDASRKSNGATVSSVAELTSTYTFNGWTTTKDGSVFLLNNTATPVLQSNVTNYTNAEGIWKKTSDTAAYAKWTNGAVTLPEITKTGYTCGWTTSATGTSIVKGSKATYYPTADTNMYGVCEACKYTIKFDSLSTIATGTTPNANCTFDKECTLSENKYAATGFTWNGWNSKSDYTGIKYANKEEVKNLTSVCDGEVTLYAKWCRNCVKPTNGNCSLDASTPGDCNYSATCKTGYTVSNEDTYKATCTANVFTIAYDGNGGDGSPGSHNCTYGQACNLSSVKPTIDHGSFDKWNRKADCSGDNFNPEADVSNFSAVNGKVITFYACYTCSTGYHWSVNKCDPNTFTIAYKANGGKNVPSDLTCTYGVACYLSSAKPTIDNGTFTKWNIKADCSGNSYDPDADVTNFSGVNGKVIDFYACYNCNTGYHKNGKKCDPNALTVAYKANSGTGTMKDTSCTYGESCKLRSNSFTKKGYHFAGWATSASGSVVYNNGADVNGKFSSGTLTLYAKWEPNTFTVVYHANEGTGSMDDTTCTYDANCSLRKNSFTNSDWTFAGWATKSNGSVVYNDSASVKNALTSGTLNLYAVWRDDVKPVITLNMTGFQADARVRDSNNKYGITIGGVYVEGLTMEINYVKKPPSGEKSSSLSCTVSKYNGYGSFTNKKYKYTIDTNSKKRIVPNLDPTSENDNFVMNVECEAYVKSNNGKTSEKVTASGKIGNGFYRQKDYHWVYYINGEMATGWQNLYWYNPYENEPKSIEGYWDWYYFFTGNETAKAKCVNVPREKYLDAMGWCQCLPTFKSNTGVNKKWVYFHDGGAGYVGPWAADGGLIRNSEPQVTWNGVYDTYHFDGNGNCVGANCGTPDC